MVSQRRLALSVGIVALAASGAFVATQLRGTTNTPVEAVETLFRAAASGDAIGVAQAMLPAERQVLLDDGIPAFRQLQRLTVVNADVDLEKVDGVSGTLSGFVARMESLRPDLAAVYITEGTLQTVLDPENLPFGSTIGKRLTTEIESRATGTRTFSLKKLLRDEPIIVKRVNGRWYFSAGYQAAELVRKRYGKTKSTAIPAAGSGVVATGGESPEAVIRGLASAVASLDIEAVLALLPPDEYAPLHEYAPAVLSAYDKDLDGIRSQFSLDFPELVLRTKRTGNTAKVFIVSSNVDFSLTDTEAPQFVVSYANNCAKVTLDVDTTTRCGSDIVNFADDYGIRLSPESLSKQFEALRGSADKRSDIGFTLIRQNGAWYWSPTRSALVAIADTMSVLETSDLPELRAQLRSIVSTFS